MKTEDRLLAFCNVVRVNMGKKPVKKLKRGYRNKALSCPIAATVGDAHVDAHEIYSIDPDSMYTRVIPPEWVGKFIDEFDEGKSPGLERK